MSNRFEELSLSLYSLNECFLNILSNLKVEVLKLNGEFERIIICFNTLMEKAYLIYIINCFYPLLRINNGGFKWFTK